MAIKGRTTPSFQGAGDVSIVGGVTIGGGLVVASREYVQKVRDWMEQANGDAEKLADLIVQNR